MAGSAAFGVALTQDDGRVLPLRIAGDDLHASLDSAQLCADVHHYMTVNEFRVAFGVVTDEVEGRARAARGGVYAVGAMVEELAKKGGQLLANGRRGQIVETVVLRRGAVPVADIRLVPDFP